MNSSILKIGGVSASILSSLILVTSCKEKPAEQAPAGLPVVNVEATAVEHGNVKIYQEWIASLRGTEDADIRAQVSGYLVSKNYKDGSFVKKGDVLFQIDKRPFQAILQQAEGVLAQNKAMYEKNKMDVERYTPLAAKGSIGEKQLDDAKQALLESEAAIVSAQAAVDQARINLDFTTIKAPISGLTGIAKPSIGNLLSSATPDPLTTISAIDPIRVDYSISEGDLLDLYGALVGKDQPRKTFEVILSNGAVYPYQGTPVSLDRNVNRDTGTINIVGQIPNPDHMLRPGMYVRVKLPTKTLQNVALVPPRAIVSMQGNSFVVMLTPAGDNLYETTIFPVTPGPLNETGRLQVITPLRGEIPANMMIVVEGTTQALQRAGGKGKVSIKPYSDKISQPTTGAQSVQEAKPEKKEEAPAPASEPKQ